MSYFGCVQIIHVEKSRHAATNVVLRPKIFRSKTCRERERVTKALGRAAIVEIDNVKRDSTRGEKEHGQRIFRKRTWQRSLERSI